IFIFDIAVDRRFHQTRFFRDVREMRVEGSPGRRQFWLRLCRMRGHSLAKRSRSGSSQWKAEGDTYKRAAGNFHEGRIRMVSVPKSKPTAPSLTLPPLGSINRA